MNFMLDEIYDFLTSKGFVCRKISCKDQDYISVEQPVSRIIIPIHILSTSVDEATANAKRIWSFIQNVAVTDNERPILIVEDRWKRQNEMMKSRLLSHLNIFFPIYARNCEVKRIDKETAADFLDANHSYSDAKCRYRYGLYIRRHTGHIADMVNESAGAACQTGDLVAVATFSNARKWTKGEKEIRSYEWTRYASLPGVRIEGGMGKLLKAFIKDVRPDDIMSYADLEWSEGRVYEQLGFALEGRKSEVMFDIDPHKWTRLVHKDEENRERMLKFVNFGSNKYRLKLTEY